MEIGVLVRRRIRMRQRGICSLKSTVEFDPFYACSAFPN
jgi:hypothetical protein